MHDHQEAGTRPSEPALRIVLLTQYYRPEVGAAQVRLQAITSELSRQGHHVEVVTSMPNYPLGRTFDGYRGRFSSVEQLDGATIRRIWSYPATGSGLRRMLGYLSFAVLSIIGLIRTERPDVIVVESPPLLAAIPAMFYRFVKRTPYVLITADLWPDVAVGMGLLHEGPMLSMLRSLERQAYRHAWKITPVTRSQVDTLLEDKAVPADKIAFLPNGVDPDLFDRRPPTSRTVELLGGPDRRVVLYAGTHGYAHGMDVMLDAAPIVHEMHPDVQFVCVGGGSERDRHIERARRERLDNVTFLPARPIEEIAELYRASWAGLSTLRPSKSLEAARPSKVFPIMASSLPVIYSGDGEGAQLITDADAGIATPGGDHRALAAAIHDLIADPVRSAAMGANGRSYVCAELAWPVLVRRWITDLGSPNQ